MTVYCVGYYSNGWNMSNVFGSLQDAQSAFNWYITLSGITYAIILSWQATSVQSWGTAPV